MLRPLLTVFCLLLLHAVFANDTVYSRPVAFKSEGYTLRGDLLLPKRSGKMPAVVFLVGSGGFSSHRTNYKGMGHELLEKQLLPEGIAILYFDKRGVQLSDGRWQDADFYDRARDAKAAIEFLKNLPEIDATKIGVAGHSQGGWIAQLVAAKYPEDVAFAVSLVGPTFSVRKQVLNDLQTQFLCKDMDSVQAHKKAVRKAAFTFAVTAIAPLQPQWKQLKVIRRFDPAKHIKAINRPILFLFGENDGLVYPSWSIARLKEMFGNNIPANITYKTIAGVNHGFVWDSLCGNGQKEKSYAPDFLETFKAYVLQQFGMSSTAGR